jgi:N-acetyl-anhydromuramyl-L-alanine amidase AmpD
VNLDILQMPARSLPERPDDARPVAVVLHATGTVDLDKILSWYSSPRGTPPHYFIAESGLIRQFADESLVAYHAKAPAAEFDLYRQGYAVWSRFVWTGDDKPPRELASEWSGYRFWRDQWCSQGYQSPLEFVTRGKPNLRSIGIEMQSLARPTPHVFNDAQYRALAALLADINDRQKIPLDRTHVLGHQDVSPLRRSREAGGYDPGLAFSYNKLWDLIGAVGRQ